MPYFLIVITVVLVEVIQIVVFLMTYNKLLSLKRRAFVFVNAVSYTALCFMPIFITLAYAAIYNL